MKKLILTATFLAASVFCALPQGLIQFDNAPWNAWPDANDRKVYFADGVTPINDPAWSARLFQQTTPGVWEPLGPACFFMADPAGAWEWEGEDRIATVPTLAVAIYDAAGAEVYRGGGRVAGPAGVDRPSFQYTRANSIPPNPADVLPLTLGAIVVPEPSTLALGVLGLGALLLFRRRK